MTENRKPQALTVHMRAALTSRYRVRRNTAEALARRGLVVVTEQIGRTGVSITLTDAGIAARDAVLAPLTPLTPGTRVRNTVTGLLGRMVRVDHGDHHDVVVLRWDNWSADTCGSPVYLEVVEEERDPADGRTEDLVEGDRVESEFGTGVVVSHTSRSLRYRTDEGELIGVVRGTPGYRRVRPSGMIRAAR